jgi:hypothetical protein
MLPAALVLVACDPAASSSSPGPSPPIASTIDPLVPFSPSPTPFQEVTSGFAFDTLTLPTSDGGTLHALLANTALPMTVRPDGLRAFSVYLTITNAGETTWTGVPGDGATIEDEAGGTNQAEPRPSAADLHPRPARLGVSNRNLMEPVSLEPGASVDGVLVFLAGGGNRPITVSVTFDGGATHGSWATSMGPS